MVIQEPEPEPEIALVKQFYWFFTAEEMIVEDEVRETRALIEINSPYP